MNQEIEDEDALDTELDQPMSDRPLLRPVPSWTNVVIAMALLGIVVLVGIGIWTVLTNVVRGVRSVIG